MNLNYAISTFCFGERYYSQTNRFIESIDLLEVKPNVYIITDSPNDIIKRDFVHTKMVSDYNAKYLKYEKNYYSFDFSVKRFSLQFAFENGYNNVILSDTDAVVNHTLYSHENVMNCFIPNSITGQVTYNFDEQMSNKSSLGNRFIFYEKMFNVYFDKLKLNSMPEDCVQFISIDNSKKFKFIETWTECILLKDKYNLKNVPAGNIDEMCFSALFNDIDLHNISNRHINLLTPRHDKWY